MELTGCEMEVEMEMENVNVVVRTQRGVVAGCRYLWTIPFCCAFASASGRICNL
jgi:hypothetical protein